MSVCCDCCVLSSRGLCDELITRPEESYRLCCVVVCDLENLKNEEAMTRTGSQRHKKTVIDWFIFLLLMFQCFCYTYVSAIHEHWEREREREIQKGCSLSRAFVFKSCPLFHLLISPTYGARLPTVHHCPTSCLTCTANTSLNKLRGKLNQHP
jgi:hypothetical protein